MASTNSTPQLGLNQWVGTDPVLREDFNADNLKIDMALSNLPSEKLFSITVEEAIGEIELDFSEIDMTKYACLDFIIEDCPYAGESTNDSGDYISFVFNEYSDTNQYSERTHQDSDSTNFQSKTVAVIGRTMSIGGNISGKIFPLDYTSSTGNCIGVAASYVGSSAGIKWVKYMGGSFETLQKIRILADNALPTGAGFSSGTKIMILGVTR